MSSFCNLCAWPYPLFDDIHLILKENDNQISLGLPDVIAHGRINEYAFFVQPLYG
jgi:hypothetical protein